MTTTKPRLLARYANGNCRVSVYEDGTKVREWDGEPKPEMPESVDLKVTNRCPVACAFCHEDARPDGDEASLDTVKAMLADARSGMEVAIGGGDPLGWSVLEPMLEWARVQGLICNVTVHGSVGDAGFEILRDLQTRDLIYGVGISWAPGLVVPESLDNIVIHVIAGIHDAREILEWPHYWSGPERLLILGFKTCGRGSSYADRDMKDNLHAWRLSLPRLASVVSSISFDNLALEQLGIRDFVSAALWERSFMGSDGVFTMYLDAVTDSFAVSSTRPRTARSGRSLRKMFGDLHPEPFPPPGPLTTGPMAARRGAG